MTGRKIVSICTPDWNPLESYARIAIKISDHFKAHGYFVNELGENHREKRYVASMGGIFLGYPTHFQNYNPLVYSGKRICITMFESDALPKGWVQALNQMDYVIVPSQFCHDVFLAEGVQEERLKLAPLGIGKDFLNYQERALEEPYQYLAFIDRGRRKGWDVAYQAFQIMADKHPNCHLTLKGKEGSLPYLVKSGVPNTTTIEVDFDDCELAEFYGKHHVLINPNTGEGFGFIPREFAATGGISVSTNFAGTADEIENWGVPIDYQEVPAWPFHKDHPGLGQWAQPDIDDLVNKLTDIQTHMEEYLEKAKTWSDFATSYYTWDLLLDLIKELWEE